MNQTDLITMLGNLSQSLLSVQQLVAGGAYLIGVIFFILAIQKLRVIGDHRVGSSSQQSMFVPLTYFFVGAGFIFLPSMLSVLTSTFFGQESILQYSSATTTDIYTSMAVLIQTIGLIWCVRGGVLVANSSKAGEKHGAKGFLFLIAGILAVNFEYTVDMCNSALTWFLNLSTNAAG